MSETRELARAEGALRPNGIILPPVRIDTASIDLMTLCGALAASGYFKDARDASQALVKVLLGNELGGIGPITSMMSIAVIEGKPAPSATLLAALVKRSGRYDYRVLRRDNDGCELAWYERGEEVGRSSFNAADAVRAKLDGKDNWKRYPRSMYFARALTDGVRTFAPDLLGGMPVYTAEELDGEPARLEPDALPPRTTAATLTERHETYTAAAIEGPGNDLKALQTLLVETFLLECQSGAQREDLDSLALRAYVGRTIGDADPILGKLTAGQLQQAISETRALPKLRSRGHALYHEAGGVTADGPAMRADMAVILGRPVDTRRTVAAPEWRLWIAHLEAQAATPPAGESTETPEGDPFQDE